MSSVRWFDVPATEVELGNSYESLDGVFDLGDGQHGFGMCHETVVLVNIFRLKCMIVSRTSLYVQASSAVQG